MDVPSTNVAPVLLENGHQMTIMWNIDDVKVSYSDHAEVKRFVDSLIKLYGDIKARHGNHHEYLGTDLDDHLPGVTKASDIIQNKHDTQICQVN